MHSPADILRNLMVNLGTCSLPTSNAEWPCYLDYYPVDPIQVIVFTDTKAKRGGRIMRTGEVYDFPGVQAFIRSSDQQLAWRKCFLLCAMFDSIVSQIVPIGDNSYVLENVSKQLGPIFIPRHLEWHEIEGQIPRTARRIQFSYVVNVHLTIRKSTEPILLPKSVESTTVTVTVVGVPNGVNLTFTFSPALIAGQIHRLHVNGVLLGQSDYTISGTTITFPAGKAPPLGATFLFEVITPNSLIGTSTFWDQQTPSGLTDGSNKIFTITPLPSDVQAQMLYVNGILQPASYYTLSGGTITFAAGKAPPAGAILLLKYVRGGLTKNYTVEPSLGDYSLTMTGILLKKA